MGGGGGEVDAPLVGALRGGRGQTAALLQWWEMLRTLEGESGKGLACNRNAVAIYCIS